MLLPQAAFKNIHLCWLLHALQASNFNTEVSQASKLNPVCRLIHLLDEEKGGFLAGKLFRAAGGAADEPVADTGFNDKNFGMLGAASTDDGVFGSGEAECLGALLEDALVVVQSEFGRAGVDLNALKYVCRDEPAGRFDPAIQIDSGDESFERIRQDGFPLAAAIAFLASSEQQVFSQAEIEGAEVQMGRADQVRLPLGQLALLGGRMLPDESFAHNKPENGVTQKLELFVVATLFAGSGLIR